MKVLGAIVATVLIFCKANGRELDSTDPYKLAVWEQMVRYSNQSGYAYADMLRLLANGNLLSTNIMELYTDIPIVRDTLDLAASTNAYIDIVMDSSASNPIKLSDVANVAFGEAADPIVELQNCAEKFLGEQVRHYTGTNTFEQIITKVLGAGDLQPSFENNKYAVTSMEITDEDINNLTDLIHFLLANWVAAIEFYREVQIEDTDFPILFTQLVTMDFSMTQAERRRINPAAPKSADDGGLASKVDVEKMRTNIAAFQKSMGFSAQFGSDLTFENIIAIARRRIPEQLQKGAAIIAVMADLESITVP